MMRFLFAAAAVVVVSNSRPTERVQRAEPVMMAGCASSPEPVDLMVLVGLLALRTLSESVKSSRPRTPYSTH